MVDYFGEKLFVGDYIVYVTNELRKPTIQEATIRAIREGHIIVINPKNSKPTKLTVPKRIIRLPR